MVGIGPGKRMMIYLGESDSWHGRSLYMSILEILRKNEIAGATVTRGLAGFGAHSRIRTGTIEVFSTDLPIIITVVDTVENMEKALALVRPMVREGLITLEDIQIIKYTHRYLQPLPADLTVDQIMTREVTVVSPDTPVRQVIELLLGKLLKAVPVIDEKRHVVGIITSSDLLHKAGMPIRLSVGQRLDTSDLRMVLDQVSQEKDARAIMTHPVFTVNAQGTVSHAVEQLLKRGLKRAPVVDSGNQLVGMLSRLDILRAAVGASAGMPEQAPLPHNGQTIAELMSSDVPIVHIQDDLVDVLQQMLRADIKRVIVLDDQDRAVGVITEGDVVARVSPGVRRNILQSLAARMLSKDMKRGRATAGELMSEHVLSAPQETTVAEAITLMLREGRKRLIVTDAEGNPVGIVDRQTLMAASLGIFKPDT